MVENLKKREDELNNQVCIISKELIGSFHDFKNQLNNYIKDKKPTIFNLVSLNEVSSINIQANYYEDIILHKNYSFKDIKKIIEERVLLGYENKKVDKIKLLDVSRHKKNYESSYFFDEEISVDEIIICENKFRDLLNNDYPQCLNREKSPLMIGSHN